MSTHVLADKKTLRVLPGNPYPLGATYDGLGVNFAIFSETAASIELCLFDSVHDREASYTIAMPEYTDQVYHCYIPDLLPGQLYGYRVDGPYDPNAGHRFNKNKVLLDPYAKSIGRPLKWNDSLFSYTLGGEGEDLAFDDRDNAAYAPLGEVIDSSFTWGDDKPPRTPWHKTIIYETHVKGITERHPELPAEIRGTYAGLASEPMIKYFKDLGVTAVELLPVHHFLDDRTLVDRGLNNYWGYNTINFFTPDQRYAQTSNRLSAVNEFKMMVRALHAAGLEVILDVVYNHTAEGNHMGPTLSFRGIDNAAYYRLVDATPRFYNDFTGCGNTLNMRHPRVLQLIMDSLRYWVLEMHVDGFRFDLASALARELHEVDKLGAFFDIIHQDPVISQVKLIAEPWDLGADGYQVGNFPILWTEWNGKYRDTMREFWKGDEGKMSEVATRLTGSSDLYQNSSRKPHASINFITCHDGFTLNDLVSYNEKHNEANGENNNDGESHNNSWNCGAEGDTDDAQIVALRARQRRNLLATLILSLGVPMISGGDEIGRSQGGNNNAYCQDNDISWYDWADLEKNRDLYEFVKKAIQIRKSQPVLQRRRFFTGHDSNAGDSADILWFDTAGNLMNADSWNNLATRCLGILMNGTVIDEMEADGTLVEGDSLLLLINAHHEPIPFTLPSFKDKVQLQVLLDTAEKLEEASHWPAGKSINLEGRSLVLLRLEGGEAEIKS